MLQARSRSMLKIRTPSPSLATSAAAAKMKNMVRRIPGVFTHVIHNALSISLRKPQLCNTGLLLAVWWCY